MFAGLDPWGYVSLRAFRQFPPKDGERDRPLHIEAVRLNLGLKPVIDAAERIALRVCNGGEPGVFAPPVCTFTGRNSAKASDVHEGPVLSVEIDQGNLEQIADRLSLILGVRPAIALYSGSVWADPESGELLPKGHLHWRLRTPARGPEQQRMLRRARDIATLIAGGDPSATPQVHPLRWPGSWNRKTDPPVMARIFEENANTAVDLTNALTALEGAAQATNLAPRNAAYLAADDLPAELAQLAEWLRVYTTPCLRAPGQGLWHDWNNVAMSIHRATGGSEAGYQLFRAWSETSRFYSETGCRGRWDAITGCPATWIGARYLRRMALERGWTPRAAEQQPDQEQPSGATASAEPPPEPDGQDQQNPKSGRELDPLQAEVERLAALPELDFDQIKRMKAEELGLDDVGILVRAVGRARRAAKAKAEAEARAQAKAAKAARTKAEAEARAAKAAAKALDAEAKAAERAHKATEARARLAAQKTPKPLADDDDDPLRDWTPPPQHAMPEIIVAPGERPAIADAGLAAMAAAGVPFYQRGKDVVRVCLIKLKLSNGAKVCIPAISIVTRPMLMRALGLCATWHAFNKELDLVRIDPPTDLGDHILGMSGHWPFQPLRGVIATQTMRYDGTLLTKPGYDPATGLMLFNPPSLPAIPERPSKQDALEALALLNDLLTGFEFADDNNVSRSGAISMLMTPVLRGMMPAAPLHFITKPDAGSGGSYMQDLMSAIALGERCPTISLTLRNDEENEKRLSAAALAGQPIIAIDNFSGTLMGNFLCQLIERPMPQVRLLGKSEMVTIPNNHCTVANGINITIGVDAVRRGVQIDLDANVENPSERTFTRDPVAEVLANRGPAVAAILTIARAYRLAGMPGKLPPRPSFEAWSDAVRSALVWLGWPDCDESIKMARAADPYHSKFAAVVTAWATELQVGIGYRTSELAKVAGEYPGDGSDRVRPALWDALFAVAGTKLGQLDVVALGNWLRDHKNRIVARYKLINDISDKSRPRWKLEPR
jgi:putative DNA primase/helicase